MNEYFKLSMKEFGLNPLLYVSLPDYSFDCWLMSSGVTLGTLQDKQILDDFVEAKRSGICGIIGDRMVNISESNRTLWYIDANKLYGYAMMQKLPFKDFKYQGTCFADSSKSLDEIKNTPDDSDHGYYIDRYIN